jgi:hypothetical protein
MQLTDYERKAIDKLQESVFEGKWSNDGLVQLIESAGNFLNLKTIPDYANKNNLSYNGVKNNRTIKELFNVKFVIDND